MATDLQEHFNTSVNSPIPSLPAIIDGQDQSFSVVISPECHGIWYDAVLVVPAVVFVVYLAFHAKKNVIKLSNGRSYIMISYYALVWVASLLNLAWCAIQAWQCSGGKEVAWNLLSLFTGSATLGLEISLVGFLLQGNYASGVEALAHTFLVSGIAVGVDTLLKVIYVFGVWGTTVHRWHRKYIWSEVGLVAHPQIIVYCTLWLHIVCAFLKIEREVTSQTSILQLHRRNVCTLCSGVVWLRACWNWS